jgi:serine-type D-Ala-D-Ala carboxypeptidase/endopeptidase (penicillin-binding protein 4)
MKLYNFLLLFLFTGMIFPQRNVLQLKTRIDSLFSDGFFDTTLAAADVYDLTQNEKLYNRNEKYLLRPGSNMKILTTTTGLIFLRPGYNFTTSLFYTGEIKNGMLYGDLYVKGGCDPEFSINDLDSLVGVIKSAGITGINGNLIGDVSMMDSLNWGKGWMWDDDCPFLTPLNINENSIGLIVKPGNTGQKANVKLIPQTDFVELNNFSVTVPADSPNTYILEKDWLNHKNIITIKGNVSAKPVPDSLLDKHQKEVYEPQLYFLKLFRDELMSRGISVSGKNYFANVPVYSKNIFGFKRRFCDIIDKVNKESYNLGAEMTLRALSAKYFGIPASADNGIKMIDSLITLTGLNPDAYRLVDGSGISHYNLVSAQLVLEVLKYMYYEKPELFKLLYDSFPISGIDGTLSHRMKGTSAENKVHAKTGTLTGVSSLSGYVTADNGHLLAFSIILQNYLGGAKTGKDYENKFCNILAEFK